MTPKGANIMSGSGAAILDDRGVLRIAGPEARDFLQGLITNDMNKVAPDRTIYAALLTPQGKFLFDFFIWERDGAFLFDCEAEATAALLKRLTMYKLRAKVAIEDASNELGVIAILGEARNKFESDKRLEGAVWSENGVSICVDPRLEQIGLRAILPKADAEPWIENHALPSLGRDDYDAHRLSLGVPKGGADIRADKSFLLESNFDELHGVDHNKGCYIGQETTSRTKRKTELRKRLLPLTLDGPLPPPETPVLAGDVEIGTLWSGREDRAIALIRMDRWQKSVEEGKDIVVGEATAVIHMPDWIPN